MSITPGLVYSSLIREREKLCGRYGREVQMVLTVNRAALAELISRDHEFHLISSPEPEGYSGWRLADAEILVVPDQKEPFRILIDAIEQCGQRLP